MQRSFNGFKYHQGSIATRLIIQFIVTEPTDLQANSLCCLPVLHFFNSAPTPFFRCPLPIFAPSSPVASGSRPPPLFHLPVAYILLCTSFSVCQFILYIYTFPFPPPPLLLFFQHPLLHLLLLLTPSQRCNSTPHIHSVISRSSDVRTSIPQIMCASIFIIFFLGGGGLKSVWKTEVGMRNCTHSDSEDTCRHRLQQKDTHSSSKVQTRKLFDRRQNKSLLHAKHERIRLMTRKLLVQVPNSQAKRAAASLALTLAQRAASYCEF